MYSDLRERGRICNVYGADLVACTAAKPVLLAAAPLLLVAARAALNRELLSVRDERHPIEGISVHGRCHPDEGIIGSSFGRSTEEVPWKYA